MVALEMLFVNEVNYDSRYLMFLEKKKEVIPVAGTAFQISSARGIMVNKELNKEYIGALLVSQEGESWLINKVDVLGFFGNTIFEKVGSIFTGTFRIKVQFEYRGQIDLKDFKDLIIFFIKKDQESSDPYLPQEDALEVVFKNIQNASKISEIFEYIKVPEFNKCLDQL